ncbi:MAG: type II toxin-antitoxin system RelE/ParE family toxin, partial [Acidobacteriaceae bacterium]
MKELRFDAADGVWRVAFAFDPKRRAILLMAGNKSGVSEKKFYRACFINRYGLKLGSLHEHVALMNWMHEQEAIRVVERCAVGVG